MNKKKVYGATAHIVVPNDSTEVFLDKVIAHIKDYQEDGFEVEVQYPHSPSSVSALVLGYRMVDVL